MPFLRCKSILFAHLSELSIVLSMQARLSPPSTLCPIPSGTADAVHPVRPFTKMNHSPNAG